jgi:hypothetical protein
MLSPRVPDRHSSPTNGNKANLKKTAVTIEDAEDIDMNQDFAPGGDADYFAEEDDEGRFFGGGLSTEQKEILNIFDNAAGEGVQEDVGILMWVGRTICRTECKPLSARCDVYYENSPNVASFRTRCE